MAYSDGDTLVRTIMSPFSGLVQDQVVNDWAFSFEAGNPTEADYQALTNAVGNFFRLGATAADRVGSYISNAIDRAQTHEIACYEISAPPLGSPVFDTPWLGPTAVGTAKNDSLPTEVAGVLSFHGVLTGIAEEAGATRPRARRRGRVYIGPLSIGAITVDEYPLLAPAFTLAMRANARTMAAAALADGWLWCVWSRTDAVLHEITEGWTDNAPDTMRKRGQDATARIVYFVP